MINIINGIKSRAAGPDSLNLEMIKCCGSYLVNFITNIVNACILDSYFPAAWKCANVLPTPKSDNPTEYGELRAISVLPVLSKVLEKVMNTQLKLYLKLNNILPDIQSGFREGHNCTTALLNVTDNILSATDSGYVTVLVLLDFSRAFDTVRHEILLAALESIGLEYSAVELIGSSLTRSNPTGSVAGKYVQFEGAYYRCSTRLNIVTCPFYNIHALITQHITAL